MGVTRLLNWLRGLKYEEKIALLCIAVVFTSCSYLICLLYASVPANEWLFGRAVAIFFKCLIAISIPGGLAIWLGNVLPSVLFQRTLEKAVSASPLLGQLGFHTPESLLHFARLHKLSLFHVPEELGNKTAENVKCRLEPLFLAPGYPSGLRDKYFKKNLLCFDDEQITAVRDKIAEEAVAVTPERVRSIVGEEKDKVIEEKDKTIGSLREELESLQKKLGKKNLGDGPYKATAWSRLRLVVEMHAALIVMGVLVKKWIEGKEYEKKDINNELKTVLAKNNGLKLLLEKLAPDAQLEVFQDDAMQLLRLAMPDGAVTWSGQQKPSLESVLLKIMTKREATDFASNRSFAATS